MNVADRITDPSTCIVRMGQGERVSAPLAELLDPIDSATLHVYRLKADSDVELHYHDIDEHWMFISGTPRITLRTPGGVMQEFVLEPGDTVACVRGMEHTLWADHELVYHQYMGVATGSERPGHLIRSPAGT